MTLPEFTVGGFVTVKIGLVDLVDATAESVGGQLGTSGTGNKGLANISVLEDRWGLDLKSRLTPITE